VNKTFQQTNKQKQPNSTNQFIQYIGRETEEEAKFTKQKPKPIKTNDNNQ